MALTFWQSLVWGVPWHGKGDLICSSIPSSGHGSPMGFKSWGILWWPWLVAGGDEQSCYLCSSPKGALQQGGMPGAEQEHRHHTAFLGDFLASSPPPPPNTVLWPEMWLR